MPYSQVTGVDIWYEVCGDGPTPILIHANPFDHDLWLYQRAHFSSWFRVVSIDIRGYGAIGEDHNSMPSRLLDELLLMHEEQRLRGRRRPPRGEPHGSPRPPRAGFDPPTLAAPLDAKVERGLSEVQIKHIEMALRGLGYDTAAIDRAKDALAPRIHREQIKKIVTRLGLDPDGDVAKAWFSVARAPAKAHERPFTRDLNVDTSFRTNGPNLLIASCAA